MAVDVGPPSSQLALAQRLGIDKTAMTYLLDDLEAAGLVTRQAHPADRRVRHVVITPAGRTALARARTALRCVEEQLMSALEPAETAALRALLVRVARSTYQAESCTTTPDATREATPTGDSSGSVSHPTAHRPPREAARTRRR